METTMNNNANKTKIALVSCGIDSAYNNVIAQNFTQSCNKYNYHVIWYQSLCNTNCGNASEIGEFNVYNLINFDEVDLLVIMSITFKNYTVLENIIQQAKLHNVPILSIDGKVDGAYSLSLDYEDGLEAIITHIIEDHSITELNFVAGEKGIPASDSRENTYRQVLQSHGIPVEEERIGYAMFWHEPAEKLIDKWYKEQNKLPRAIICANDSMAIGVCNKVLELGFRIPEDVIVTGMDGIDEALTYSPCITTSRRNIVGAAERCAELAHLILSKQIVPNGHECMKSQILFNKSCGCNAETSMIYENRVKYSLYRELDRANNSSESIINLAEGITGEHDFVGTLKKLGVFLEKLWTKSAWICICDDFLTNIKVLDDVYFNHSYNTGYSEYIGIVVHCENRHPEEDGSKAKIEIVPSFKTSELLPNLDKLMDIDNNFMVFPLHFQDRAIGYIVFEFNNCLGNYYLMNTFNCSVSMALENARIQSELHGFANKLEEMYVRDSMTNLMNRRGFYQLAPQIYERCINEKLEFMVISVDLDDLKAINDCFGHSEGDNAIVTTAKSLIASADDEIIARFGGDEYVVAGICKSDSYGEDYIKKINQSLDDYNEQSGKPYKVHASCGIYKLTPYDGLSLDEFITNADEMMYNQKLLSKRHRCASRARI